MALNSSDKNKLNKKPKSVFIRLQESSTKLLIVEGDGDEKFYSNYINSEEVCPVDKTKEYIKGDPDYKEEKLNAKSFVQFLVDKHLKRVKENPAITYGKCFGIIDNDFDGIDSDKYPDLGKNLITTDARDLETTLLKHDYNHLKELFSEDFNTDNSSIDIHEKAINNAAQIGKLRKLREDQRKTLHGKLTKDISINFKAKEPDDIGYLPFVTEDLDFAFDSYVGTQYSKEQISKLKNPLKTYTKPSLFYCRGHDIFDFIACFYTKQKKLKPVHTSKGRSILKIRGVFEDKLREYFDDSEFKSSSPMYQFIVSNFSETIPH
ncbi:MAG: DUF4435 domain-containing protein [Treponema sp.]|nr:DUF4435 domain-containing protein [Treponema sp.]